MSFRDVGIGGGIFRAGYETPQSPGPGLPGYRPVTGVIQEREMKRLFLSSSFADVADVFKDWVGEPVGGKTITFIPTASIPEKVTFYVEAGRKALEKLGFVVDELDISTATDEEIGRTLRKNEYIYVSGGNTFFLLQELRRSGADKLILEQIAAGKCYIGESAGSIIVSPNIEYVKDMDDHADAPALRGFDALRAVDFYPLPHYTNFPFKKAVEKIIAKYGQRIPLYPISNAQVIFVNGDTIVIR
jgi:dipeptidase E